MMKAYLMMVVYLQTTISRTTKIPSKTLQIHLPMTAVLHSHRTVRLIVRVLIGPKHCVVKNIDTFGKKNSFRGGKRSSGQKNPRNKYRKRASGGSVKGSKAAMSNRSKGTTVRKDPRGKTGGSGSRNSLVQQPVRGGGISAMET